MKLSSINQDPIVDVEVSRFYNMKVALFVLDSFEDVVDVVMHYCSSVKPFLCIGVGEFVVVIKVDGA